MQYYFAIIKYYIALSAGGGDSRIFQPLFSMSTFQERILAASGSSSSTADTDVYKRQEYMYPFVDTDDEVFEWWLVSPYLARELKEQGEVIIDALGCHWWGRTTSGQAIYMDGVIQKIAGE